MNDVALRLQQGEIVEYARQRHITVIPEIDMPGHMVAALAAYPELGCTPGPFEVRTPWGVADDILCPSEQTFQFITGVLSEVMEVFPSRYIHLGGDEAPTIRWEQSPLAQDIIRREKLKDEHALQGWFLAHVADHLAKRGRRIVGWDEKEMFPEYTLHGQFAQALRNIVAKVTPNPPTGAKRSERNPPFFWSSATSGLLVGVGRGSV